MAWSAARMEGLPVAKPIYQMMAAVDDVVENAIRNNTLGPNSPYIGWTLEQFQVRRHTPHASTSRAPRGPKPVKPNSQLRDSASHLEDPR